MNFAEREKLVCDGTYDGGLDAYYINPEKRRIFLLQSKFRTTDENFEAKGITSDYLIKMEIDRILKGKPQD